MNTKAVIGELIFCRFVYAHLLTLCDVEVRYSPKFVGEYKDLVLRGLVHDPDDDTLIKSRLLTCNLAPLETVAFATFANLIRSDYFRRSWKTEDVRRHWYFHQGLYNRDGISDGDIRFESGLFEIGVMSGVYVTSDQKDCRLVIDPYGLCNNTSREDEFVIYRGVICDIRDQLITLANASTSVLADGSEEVVSMK